MSSPFDLAALLRGLHPDTSSPSATPPLAGTILHPPARSGATHWEEPGTGGLDASLTALPPGRALLVDGSGATLGQMRWQPRPDEPRAVVAFRAGGPSA
jgi:hypothetical protein